LAFRPAELPIGVFDSGVGGLTVLEALRNQLPHESFLYLGDTARLPYGTKSPQTVERYALQAAQVLVDRGIKLLVIACNTASAVAVDSLRRHFAPLPLTGVVEPGAEAATAASQTGRIAVIGTESTIRGGAYEREIRKRRPDAVVTGQPCPLFVALAEEGWVDGDVPQAVARRYLGAIVGPDRDEDCLVLGCTHFPVLAGAIRAVVGDRLRIVDSALTTAAAVDRMLSDAQLRAPEPDPSPVSGSEKGPKVRLLATDDPERFARVGAGFLGVPLSADDVELVDL
jgi:glutamate racemase